MTEWYNSEHKNDEDTEGLINRFFDSSLAAEVIQDFQEGEHLLSLAGNLEVPAELTADIKSGIKSRLSRRSMVFTRIAALKIACIAAIALTVIFSLSYNRPKAYNNPAAVLRMRSSPWTDIDSAGRLNLLTQEVDQAASAVTSARYDGGEENIAIVSAMADNLEKELIETESETKTTFWKG